jgi:hypothetical protein
MRLLQKHWIFLSLLLLGIIVRLVFMHYQGLSNDELSAWHRTHFSTWNDFWVHGVKVGDMHPAFYQVLLWLWLRVFGDSEFALRSTSLLFYIFTSLLIYRIGIRHFSKFSGLMTQALFVGLTFTIMNTVFARPYNSGVFFLLLAFYGILELKVVQEKYWKWTWIISIGLVGAMLSHYFAFLVALVLSGLALFYLGKPKIRYLISAGILAVLLYLPHLPITLFQVGRGGLGWLAAPTIAWPVNFVHLFFNESWLLSSLICTAFLVLIVFSKRKWSTTSTFALAVFLVAFIGAFTVSHVFTPILREIVMQFILPFLFLPIFYIIDIKSRKVKIALIFSMALIPTADSFLRNELLKPVHYGVFKEIGEAINAADKKYGRENITYVSNFNHIDYINYYVEKDLNESIIDWENSETMDEFIDRVSNAKTDYLCYSFSNRFTVPMYFEVIRSSFPEIIQTVQTRYSFFVLFAKSVKKRKFGVPILSSKSSCPKETNDEFSDELFYEVSKLPLLKSPWDYYLLRCKTKMIDTIPLFLTLTIERNGEAWKRGEDLAVYFSYDFSKLSKVGETKDMICAFNLPKDILPTDKLKCYIWNPQKGRFSASEIEIYSGELK